MPELRFEAAELQGTKVDFVALVKRGANRIPFRIVKQEDEDMLDLSKIGRTLFKKSEAGPQIIAAVVPASTDTELLVKAFTEAGLDPKLFVKSEENDVVTLAKSDAPKGDDVVVIKTGDDLGLVIAGVKKAFDAYSGHSSFSEAIKAQGFYPSFCTAREVLHDVVFHDLQKATSPSEAAERVSKTITDFNAYVTLLAAELPQKAFYVDRFYENYVKSEASPAAAEVAVELEKAGEAEKDKTKVDEEAAVEKADDKPDDNAATEVLKAEDKPKEQPAAPAVKEEEKVDMAALLKSAMEDMQKSFSAALGDTVKAVKEEVAGVSKRVDEVAVMAKKTEAALNGSVFAEPGEDPAHRTRKSEGPRTPPLLDTAYTNRAAG